MKTCGCIVDYVVIPGNEQSTCAPMEEVAVSYCEGHDPNNLLQAVKTINSMDISLDL